MSFGCCFFGSILFFILFGLVILFMNFSVFVRWLRGRRVWGLYGWVLLKFTILRALFGVSSRLSGLMFRCRMWRLWR